MDQIVVIDHFFEQKDVNDIIFKIEKKWDCMSINKDYIDRSISTAYYMIDLTDDLFFSKHLKRIIDSRLNYEYRILRISALCQNIFQNCVFHVDHEIFNTLEYEKGQNKYCKDVTFCYYLHSSEEDEGSLYFKTEDKHILCFETKKNRGVLFPGYLLHSPLGYKNDMNLRICITWKMERL